MTTIISANEPVRLNYTTIRNISTPEEIKNGALTYSAVLDAKEILKLGTEGNLRTYIPEHNRKKRSMVHRSIEKTIRDECDRFSQLNSGFLIGASKAKLNDVEKNILIWDASINNGAQSQGEIKLYYDECSEIGDEPNQFNVRAEISIDPDSAMRTKIAIARNTATKVQGISSAGAQGYFDELAEVFSKENPGYRLAKKETDYGEEVVDTRQVLQILWALIPDELAPASRRSVTARMRSYMNAASCLDDFTAVCDNRKTDPESQRRYQYFLDMVGSAWKLYEQWRTHPEWEKLRLREDAKQVKRSANGKVEKVADGVLFPIIAALSKFVRFDTLEGRWKYSAPSIFPDKMMAKAARSQLSAHDGKPMLMGRSSSAYEALHNLTEMAVDFEESEQH